MRAVRRKTKPEAETTARPSILQGARDALAFARGKGNGCAVHVEETTFVCNLLEISAAERPPYRAVVLIGR